jgi:hypothetical protein
MHSCEVNEHKVLEHQSDAICRERECRATDAVHVIRIHDEQDAFCMDVNPLYSSRVLESRKQCLQENSQAVKQAGSSIKQQKGFFCC